MQKNEQTSDEELQVIMFRLEKEVFGLDINKIRYIVKYPDITEVPNALPFVHGVMNLRGRIIVVVDLSKKIGLPMEDISKDTRVIIVEIGQGWVGLIVDSVTEVIKIPKKEIKATPRDVGGGISHNYIKGVYPYKENLLIIFDTDNIFSDQELGTNEK